MFTQSVIEQLGYYVYFLRDPRDYKVFYVGKGKGNRVFEHVAGTLASATESEKMDRIREISQAGKSVEHFVLRHGLSESSAFEVEAAIIDFVGLPNVANIQGGRNSTDFGIRTTEEVSAMYSAAPFETHERVILINIHKLFRRDMTATELYDATRKEWRIGPRREYAEYAVATYRGLTREVYKICRWYQIGLRWGFDGKLADEPTRSNLRYMSSAHLIVPGAANPFRYVNCWLKKVNLTD